MKSHMLKRKLNFEGDIFNHQLYVRFKINLVEFSLLINLNLATVPNLAHLVFANSKRTS